MLRHGRCASFGDDQEPPCGPNRGASYGGIGEEQCDSSPYHRMTARSADRAPDGEELAGATGRRERSGPERGCTEWGECVQMETAAGGSQWQQASDQGIRGIGCDVEEHSTIARGLCESAGRWASRVLTSDEHELVSAHPVHQWGTAEAIRAAELWSAKESVAKAIGVLDQDPWRWKDVDVGLPVAGDGHREVRLLGTAEAVGRRAGITRLRVRTGLLGDHVWATAVACAGHPHRQSSTPQGKGKRLMSTNEAIITTVRRVLDQHGHIARGAAELSAAENLYSAGMTSHASVNVMLALEDEFDIEFPEQKLTKETFESIGSIAAAVADVQAQS